LIENRCHHREAQQAEGEIMELSTIKELCEKIKSGEIIESDLLIMIDRDSMSFYRGEEEICIKELEEDNGVSVLCKLLFPGASTDWC
jgi:hypothetical protein